VQLGDDAGLPETRGRDLEVDETSAEPERVLVDA